MRIWDFPGRRKLRDIPSDSRWVRSAIFSSKGQFAFGQDRVFLAEADGKIFKTINKHAGPLCFSPDGRRLAGTTWQQGLVTVWNVDTGKEIASSSSGMSPRLSLNDDLGVTVAERERLLELGLRCGSAIKELITIVTPRTFMRWAAGVNRPASGVVGSLRIRKAAAIRSIAAA